jgi:ubiquitin C-terminal hydrolase
MSVFPLRNFNGSCWINATLQGLFRSPLLQKRYQQGGPDTSNPVDVCLHTIWMTKGEAGLKDLFECIRTSNAMEMPAGRGTGDSHELLQFFCDKLPWLDEATRFKVADSLTCQHCKDHSLKEDSINEVHITPSRNMSILEAIQEACTPVTIPERKCEKCHQSGCTKQLLFGTFPRLLVFHRSTLSTTTEYSSILVLNGKKYALFSVICYNGSHWWTYGRDLPVGNAWYRLDDHHIQEITNKQFPVAGSMRMLLYFLVED